MKVISDLEEARACVKAWTHRDARVGIVPTMGALHAGHLSLVRESRQRCQFTAATIFVNPTQFGPGEDFDRYPRTLDADLAALESAGADLVFTPDATAMFPAHATTAVTPPRVAATLEGRFRPGHFAGVATVVLKLFHLLPGTDAFFGEKDFQQLLVIRHMVRDLNVDIAVHGCPIVREADGMALSSRNRYLDPQQRQQATAIYQTLNAAKESIEKGSEEVEAIEEKGRRRLMEAGFDRVDYWVIRDAASLCSVDSLQQPVVILIAAHLGNTRLIDNMRAQRPAP